MVKVFTVGNIIMGDDAIAQHITTDMITRGLIPAALCYHCGTDPLRVVAEAVTLRRAIIIDCSSSGRAIGTVWEPSSQQRFKGHTGPSGHGIGLPEALKMMLSLGMQEKVVLIAIEGHPCTEPQPLSKKLQELIPTISSQVYRIIKEYI